MGRYIENNSIWSIGRTGLILVKRLLEGNHEVTAYVRNPSVIKLTSSILKVIKGSLLDFDAVSRAMKGQEKAYKTQDLCNI